MEFRYKAKKSLNEVVEGNIKAENLEQAVEKLGREGIVPVVVEPIGSDGLLKETQNDLKLIRLSAKKITLFTKKLYNLSKSNVELLTAIRIIEQQSSDRSEKLLLQDTIKSIKEGDTLSQSISRYPNCFSRIYIDIVRAGESSGQLKEAFSQLLNYLERLEELRAKVRQALAYPIFMMVVGAGTVFVMLTFILPRLAVMFSDFQSSLPLPTRLLLGLSGRIKKYWLIIIVFCFFIFFILQKVYAKKGGFLKDVKYRLPLVRQLVYKQAIANFSASLALLLKSGTNLLSALGIAAPIIGNPKYIAQLEKVRKNIKEGFSFSKALEEFKIFPVFFIQMLKVGEEGGRLDIVLADIADSYEQEIEADLKIISALIEPAIILVLGLIIGGMIIAVLLPIFNINALVG